MKLLLVGYFSQDPSIYTYATSFIHPLQKLGFEVKTFNYRTNFFLSGKFRLHTIINQCIINQQLLNAALKFKPDVMFCIKAETIQPKTLLAIKKQCSSYLVNFYPDSPFALWNGNSTVNIVKGIAVYDHFLIWSHELIPALISAGCKQISYFPFAFDNELFAQNIIITEKDQRYFSSDVCFVGTWEPERAQWLDIICKKLPFLTLAIWGNEWFNNVPPTSVLYNKIRGNAIYGMTMRKAFACSKIILNFIRRQNIQAHNMRTFEVPASKTFLLTQRTYDQATLLFKEGESIACFATPDELMQKIIFYINNEQERDIIVQNSFLRAQEFTLEKQLSKLYTSFVNQKGPHDIHSKTQNSASFIT